MCETCNAKCLSFLLHKRRNCLLFWKIHFIIIIMRLCALHFQIQQNFSLLNNWNLLLLLWFCRYQHFSWSLIIYSWGSRVIRLCIAHVERGTHKYRKMKLPLWSSPPLFPDVKLGSRMTFQITDFIAFMHIPSVINLSSLI